MAIYKYHFANLSIGDNAIANSIQKYSPRPANSYSKSTQDIQAEIIAVRSSRYANFRPEIACVLPVTVAMLPPSPNLVEIDKAS